MRSLKRTFARTPLSRPEHGGTWVVHLHGHGSTGDQIYTRSDMRDAWLEHYLSRGLGVLSANLRGNAWMRPEAVEDMCALLGVIRVSFVGNRTDILMFHHDKNSKG